MDLQKSSAVVLEEEEASDSPASSVIQLESVCDNSTRSVSVSANLGSDSKMEKNTKSLLNCRACSRAKSSYDNHGFECFRCCNCSPSLPCSQSRQFTQRRWDRIFDSLHLTIRVNPSSHSATTSATQGLTKPESSVVQAQKSSVTASLFEDNTGHMANSPQSQSRSHPKMSQVLGRQYGSAMEQVEGGYGEGSVRRRETASERAPKRRPDEFELFERYSKPPSKKVRENTSEESTRVYNYSSNLPLNTTAGVLDSEYRPSPEYDLENDFDILPDSDEDNSKQTERIWSEREFNNFCFKQTNNMIPELVPHLYTEYSDQFKAQPSHVYAESFDMPEERPPIVSKRIDHFREQFSYTLKENGAIAFPRGHPLNNPLGRFEEKTPIRLLRCFYHQNTVTRSLFY